MAQKNDARQILTDVPVSIGTANAEGISLALARADHVHDLTSGAISSVLASKRLALELLVEDFTTTASSFDSNNILTKSIIDASPTKILGGDGSNPGIIASAPTNLIRIRDRATNKPLSGEFGGQVYGRLTPNLTPLTLTYTWNGSLNILVSGDPTTELSVGDFIALDSDGQYFEIASFTLNQVFITNPASLIIPSGAGGTSDLNFVLSYYIEVDPAIQQAHTFSVPETIDFLFYESINLEDSDFDFLQKSVTFLESGGVGTNITETVIPLENIAKGDAVAVSSTPDRVIRGNSGGTDERARVFAIATATVSAGNPVAVVHRGLARNILIGATAGQPFFLAPTGGIQTSIPTGAGEKVIIVGYAVNATDMEVIFHELTSINRNRVGIELIGTKDGVNQTFTTPDIFVEGTLRVFYNGVRLHKGVTHDYTTSESGGIGTGFDTMVFTVSAPLSDDHVTSDYVIAEL